MQAGQGRAAIPYLVVDINSRRPGDFDDEFGDPTGRLLF
jgi:hypothetical protein